MSEYNIKPGEWVEWTYKQEDDNYACFIGIRCQVSHNGGLGLLVDLNTNNRGYEVRGGYMYHPTGVKVGHHWTGLCRRVEHENKEEWGEWGY